MAQDWSEFWQSLGWTDETINEDDLQQRLRTRAAQYARVVTDDDHIARMTVLMFELGTEYYALDVMAVQTVRADLRMTSVPGLPAFYPGVMNNRGRITTVLDLRQLFDVPVDSPADEVIVVRSAGLELGLLATRVRAVLDLPLAEIQPVENMRYARGITPDRITVLDVARLFEDDRLVIGGNR
jgi:purine-binding chemotaxis protein CheW